MNRKHNKHEEDYTKLHQNQTSEKQWQRENFKEGELGTEEKR